MASSSSTICTSQPARRSAPAGVLQRYCAVPPGVPGQNAMLGTGPPALLRSGLLHRLVLGCVDVAQLDVGPLTPCVFGLPIIRARAGGIVLVVGLFVGMVLALERYHAFVLLEVDFHRAVVVGVAVDARLRRVLHRTRTGVDVGAFGVDGHV